MTSPRADIMKGSFPRGSSPDALSCLSNGVFGFVPLPAERAAGGAHRRSAEAHGIELPAIGSKDQFQLSGSRAVEDMALLKPDARPGTQPVRVHVGSHAPGGRSGERIFPGVVRIDKPGVHIRFRLHAFGGEHVRRRHAEGCQNSFEGGPVHIDPPEEPSGS